MADGKLDRHPERPFVPGPVDRVHFLDDQRRHRRASWQFSLFAVAAVVLSGLPLCVLISPPIFGFTLVLVRVVDLVAPVSPAVWDVLEQIARALPNAWAAMRGYGTATSWGLLVVAAVLPGASVMLVTWLWIRLLFRRVGVGGVLRRLRARSPNPEVVEELQVINIVEEMAIAAGVRPPRVMLIDSPAANAAAVGLTIDDATILIRAVFSISIVTPGKRSSRMSSPRLPMAISRSQPSSFRCFRRGDCWRCSSTRHSVPVRDGRCGSSSRRAGKHGETRATGERRRECSTG